MAGIFDWIFHIAKRATFPAIIWDAFFVVKVNFNQSFLKAETLKSIEKYSWVIIVILIGAGLLIRIYSASIIPIVNDDEQYKLNFAHNISFNPNKLNLPLGDRVMRNPILSSYVLKLGMTIFGDSKLGSRMIFILLGTISLICIFKLIQEYLGTNTALLSLFFLIFSQYHIGITRFIKAENLFFSFVPPALYMFFKMLKTKKSRYVTLTALVVGVGCLAYEAMAMLILTFVAFLLLNKDYRSWLKRKELYISGFLVLAIISPHLIWSYQDSFSKFHYEHLSELGFSMRSFYLYFGEILAWFGEESNLFLWNLSEENLYLNVAGKSPQFISSFSNEIPFIHFPLGMLIFGGFIYSLCNHENNPLIKFCLLTFSLVFFITSIIAGSHSLLDDHWWASMTLFPGVIMCSTMLIRLQKKFRFTRPVLPLLIIYFIVHTGYFINLPESQFALPRIYLHDYYLNKAEIYLTHNKKQRAAQQCRWVLARSEQDEIVARAKHILSRIEL